MDKAKRWRVSARDPVELLKVRVRERKKSMLASVKISKKAKPVRLRRTHKIRNLVGDNVLSEILDEPRLLHPNQLPNRVP